MTHFLRVQGGRGGRLNFFLFILRDGKCARVFYWESKRKFWKGTKSCDSRPNQTSFQNIRNFRV